jgi:hypothetical protein
MMDKQSQTPAQLEPVPLLVIDLMAPIADILNSRGYPAPSPGA